MSETRWVQVATPGMYAWPDLTGKRHRVTIGADMLPELLEIEAARLPGVSGWYRLPDEFGVVFLRDDGAWLDARGNRVSMWTLPDGLVRLVDDEGAPR